MDKPKKRGRKFHQNTEEEEEEEEDEEIEEEEKRTSPTKLVSTPSQQDLAKVSPGVGDAAPNSSVRDLEEAMNRHLPTEETPGILPASHLLRSLYANRESVIRSNYSSRTALANNYSESYVPPYPTPDYSADQYCHGYDAFKSYASSLPSQTFNYERGYGTGYYPPSFYAPSPPTAHHKPPTNASW